MGYIFSMGTQIKHIIFRRQIVTQYVVEKYRFKTFHKNDKFMRQKIYHKCFGYDYPIKLQ